MNIIWIGCDFHPSFQCVAMVDTETGEYVEHKLDHACGEAVRFYEGLKGRLRDHELYGQQSGPRLREKLRPENGPDCRRHRRIRSRFDLEAGERIVSASWRRNQLWSLRCVDFW